ncbi:hypothetical protein SCHPADRAFT_26342 [Schizopora paradoxa]|uniref:HAD-like protein n=1 Tax=Schizopora paradoxa TaxID=27342 RepID=A0A0H2SSF8_9AGAM|nr:hypothetical protein SCHPADRAFT_26342 [Schizopora paradoxa]
MTGKLRIAVDLDDVLAHTNLAAAQWHNERFGTKLELKHFYYVNYWKNPHWGTKDEATAKIKDFFTECIMDIKPVQDAYEQLRELRIHGFEFIVVTARHIQEEGRTKLWLEKHYPGIFEKLICTGKFYKDAAGLERFMKTSKREVCELEKVSLLIDDSVENAMECSWAVPILLFGNYPWNRRISKEDHPDHFLSHAQRLVKSGGYPWWESETVGALPRNVIRVGDWSVVAEKVLAMFEPDPENLSH